MSADAPHRVGRLLIVLGDQLDAQAAAFDGFDAGRDTVWMAEVAEESTHVWSAKPRIVLFLAAMRHFAEALRNAGRPLRYTRLDAPGNRGTLAAQLQADIEDLRPAGLVLTAPGDWRVLQAIKAVAAAAGLPLDLREDRHFFGTVRHFAAHARAHGGALRLEVFYREQRQRHGILMEPDDPAQALGGRWNFDTENRRPFPASGPVALPSPLRFSPDAITREVIALVETRFADHPGETAAFDWPVNRAQALQALDDFIAHRLPNFGPHQDAMWPGRPWLWHAQLSAALNLKLLDPREVVAAAVKAHADGRAPLPSVEGFVRQILGWREYVRGVYWTQMPGYQDLNVLDAHEPLPAWYWTGDTDMACLRDAIGQTLRHGYAHHIQRLMVTGLFAQLLGVEPVQVHAWYLSVYVDAVEWVEMPNTLGMSQYADGGLMGSKPYVASGRYIERMSPACKSCRYRPAESVGDDACPFTTLYWDFLLRHRALLAGHPRLEHQLRSADRLDAQQRAAIKQRSAAIRRGELGQGADQPPAEPELPW
ncbi:cryptochrome/photolyase family protein [Xylophilus rhododendri]|uniref:Cryptochrome/photolyase family protein n=2 Tax=Xylophilus rhododendri TaxID=2697032 RepID=A0A857JBU8_9BURK|nr:cryptochrome/photolyase family protein [Xylophilus rhododendri]